MKLSKVSNHLFMKNNKNIENLVFKEKMFENLQK